MPATTRRGTRPRHDLSEAATSHALTVARTADGWPSLPISPRVGPARCATRPPIPAAATKGLHVRNRTKLLLVALTAAITLGALLSTASANRIAQSNQNFRATWSALRFIGFVTVECHVTIEGSFHSRTLAKVAEALVGYVSRATVDEGHCTGGSARVIQETLPWHLRYQSFTGTLPRISGITDRQVGSGFQVTGVVLGFPVTCQITSTAASPMVGINNVNTTTGQVESLRPDETALIPVSSGGGSCGSSGRLAGTSTTLTLLGATTKITVTLVA
jgi:hypothetical protein